MTLCSFVPQSHPDNASDAGDAGDVALKPHSPYERIRERLGITAWGGAKGRGNEVKSTSYLQHTVCCRQIFTFSKAHEI